MKYVVSLALFAVLSLGFFTFAPSADASCYYFCSGYSNYYGRARVYDLQYSRDRYYDRFDSYYRSVQDYYYRDDIVRTKKKQASYDNYYGYKW